MKNAKWIQSGAVGISALAMLAVASPATFADSSATTWTVDVGAMQQSGVMAMSFFPNVITIDAGDSINFDGAGHTVSFPGSDGKMPPTGSPQAQAPAGTSTYDGSTFTASGIITSKPYELQFTKPGVYPYYCLLHPGMMGVVIVNPAATAYPKTQAQYDAAGQQEQQVDFDAGNKAVNSFQLKTKKNANGTTTYFAQMDAPQSQASQFDLTSVTNSSVAGSALIAFSAPPSKTDMNVTYSVTAKLKGLTPGQTYTAMLCEGASNSGVMVPNSQFGTVTVNADGTGTVVGSVKAGGIPQGIWNLDIYDANQKVVTTGLSNSASFAYERFLPNNLKIHDGDSVVWTQTGPNEIHTITFLPTSWSDVSDESLMPVPYGSNIYAGTGFLNSGFVVPGSSYTMTFIKTGDYQYRCLLHDVMGMISNVDVLPNVNNTTIAWNNAVVNIPSKVHGGTTYVPTWYVMQLLKNAGVQSTWNGHDLKLTTGLNLAVKSTTGLSNRYHLYINGQLAGNAAGQVWKDPNSGKNTTYMSVTDLQNFMKSLGMTSTFDGNTWDLMPSAHAGSTPSVPSGSNASDSNSNSTANMPGM